MAKCTHTFCGKPCNRPLHVHFNGEPSQYCGYHLRKHIRRIRRLVREEEEECELPVCEHCGSILAHPCDCQLYTEDEICDTK